MTSIGKKGEKTDKNPDKIIENITIGNVFFKVSAKLGEGSYGSVYRVSIDDSGKEYALKVIKNAAKEGIKSLRELDIMARINHPNIAKAEMIVVDYIEKITKKKKKIKYITRIGILMEIAEKDLYKALFSKTFTPEKALDVLKQVCLGCKFLHESNYLHLDIKPLNILIYPNNIARITDFGLSLHTNEKRQVSFPVKLMTIDHRSPNILKGGTEYSEADDVWSLGITFLDVLSKGKSLFSDFKKKRFHG